MSVEKVRGKDLCWSVRMVYGSRGLLGVSSADSGVDGVLQGYDRLPALLRSEAPVHRCRRL